MSTPLSTPDAETLFAASEALAWRATEAPGFLEKPLFEADGRRTLLMKMEPGCFSPMHAHEETEEFLVLDGSFRDQDRTYTKGDYAIRAPGFMHEAASDDGAVVLLVYW